VTSADAAASLTYEPPGPGTWEIDAVHFPRPATRYWTEMHPEPFRRGFAEFPRYYGMLFGGRASPCFLGTHTRPPSPRADSLINRSLSMPGMAVGWTWMNSPFA